MQDNQPHNDNGEAKPQESGQLPAPSTLANTFEAGTDQAMYEHGILIVIVQDHYKSGGGYRLQIVGIDQITEKCFDELEQVETYLAENTQYSKYSSVWMPLSAYFSWMFKLGALKRRFEREELR